MQENLNHDENLNHYQILGVSVEASAIEIKKAYFAQVRKFPPERFPEEFKRIREAYDILSDPESKEEYDINQEHLLALCLIEIEEYDKAAAIYKKLVSECPENAVFHHNLGEALLFKGAYRQALGHFENALRLEKSHVFTWIKISDCYFAGKDYEKVREVLETGLREFGENISICKRLIDLDIFQKNMVMLTKDINRLEKLAKKDPAMKENVAWYLADIGEHLMTNMELADFAAKLLEKAKKLNPDEKQIKAMYKDASKMRKLQEPLERLKKDDHVHHWIKDVVEKVVVENDDFLADLDRSVCERLLLRNPANVLSSVEHIKNEYPEIFKKHKKFFQKILDHPTGVKINETELLRDLKMMEVFAGRMSEDDEISLDDVSIPPMQRINIVKVGRNDPCPCGSGKKYKKCCGA